MSRIINVGIIGCGGIANMKHLPALSAISNVHIVAFYNMDKEKAVKACEKYGTDDAIVYEELDAFLQDERTEVVHVCTPNVSHAKFTIAALNAKKHVMCEKPMATTVAEAEAMIKAAKDNNRKLTIGLQNRFRKDTMSLKKECDSGMLGEIYYARAQSLRRRGVPTWGVMANKEFQGGGALMDIGVHSMDMALWLMNNYDVDYVSAITSDRIIKKSGEANLFGPWDPAKCSVEEASMGMVHMKNGAAILVEAAWAINIPNQSDEAVVMGGREARVTLCGDKAGAEIWTDGYNLNGSRDAKLYDEHKTFDFDPQYEGALEEAKTWINAIETDTDPIVLPEQALVLVKITEAFYKSAKEKKAIKL